MKGKTRQSAKMRWTCLAFYPKRNKELTQKIAGIVKEELAKKVIELYDIKFEFGRDKETNEIMLIDEISGGNMRAYKNGEYIEPLELEKLILEG